MSKYTTELRFICESLAGNTPNSNYTQVIATARPLIFSFQYPIFDQAYKQELETKILKHYYTREICAETYGRWKMFLDDKMNMIMPYYNQLYKSALIEFEPLQDVKYTINRTGTAKVTDATTNTAETTAESTGNVDLTNTNTKEGTTGDKITMAESETPQGSLQNIEDLSYLSKGQINNTNGTYSDTTEAHEINNNTNNFTQNINNTGSKEENKNENYIDTITGKQGTASFSKMIIEFRETFLNIDNMVIEELADLFFNLY